MDPDYNNLGKIARAHESLWILFQHFVALYILNCTVVWPRTVSDRKMLDRLYSLVFDTIKEIQLRLPVHHEHLELLTGEHVHDTFILKDNKLYNSVRYLEPVGLGKSTSDLLDMLWKVGLDFVPDALLHTYELNEKGKNERKKRWSGKMKDWRNELNWYVNRLPQCEKCDEYITLGRYPWRAENVVVNCDNCYAENTVTIEDGTPRK
jgi:hypothetical protein